MPENTVVEFMPACRHDFPDIVGLARDQMPEMTALHDERGWQDHGRLGMGRHPRETFVLVARQGDSLLGFCWVDAAAVTDYGVAEPWWCINAVAVRGDLQGKGLGSQFAKIIKQQAEQIGITMLYGTCYPSSAAFWRHSGFVVGELEQDAQSDRPVKLLDGQEKGIAWQCEPGNHIFMLNVGDDSSAARLTFE